MLTFTFRELLESSIVSKTGEYLQCVEVFKNLIIVVDQLDKHLFLKY